MALTYDGRELTEAHRLAQIGVGARAELDARALWSLLDPNDLDASEPRWMAASLNAMRPHFEDSQRIAGAYLSEYRTAEGVLPSMLVRPDWDQRYMAQNLHLAGPVRVKLLVGKGLTSDAAIAAALTQFAGIARRGVMSGGRLMLHETVKRDANAIGWRRVTDGDPCAFCAMLATRGPVYGKETVTLTSGGLRYHGHCGCTGEIVYGHWEPSPVEQLYIEEYRRAAAEVDELGLPRTEKNVLPRMRGGGVFRDSPLVRNKTTS